MAGSMRQVGGDHYQTAYIHWDWVLNLGLGYLEGNITKYICRWRKKDGIRDLQKAAHYTNKLLHSWQLVDSFRAAALFAPHKYHADEETAKFAAANGLTAGEARVCELLATWVTVEDLQRVRDLIEALIEEATPAARPVPLSDSNKHAERAK